MIRLAAALALTAGPLAAQDIFVLGEVHDNPAHHAVQAQRVSDMAPTAIVFEMLAPGQVAKITPESRLDPRALATALDWENSGWPDFSFYYPILQAAPEARLYGAHVPRSETQAAAETGIVAAFGPRASEFGLPGPLPADQQADREAMQSEAHCGALPVEVLPLMVEIQRLRDATLARAALDALRDTGGPVAVITGNGHARSDWGMPATIALAAPDVEVHALGQGENGAAPQGVFDKIASSPAPVRPDPCEAFR